MLGLKVCVNSVIANKWWRWWWSWWWWWWWK